MHLKYTACSSIHVLKGGFCAEKNGIIHSQIWQCIDTKHRRRINPLWDQLRPGALSILHTDTSTHKTNMCYMMYRERLLKQIRPWDGSQAATLQLMHSDMGARTLTEARAVWFRRVIHGNSEWESDKLPCKWRREKKTKTHAVKLRGRRPTHQLLEQMSHSDLLVPLLDVGQEGVIELFVDLENVLDFVEDGLYLLNGEDGLRGRGCGFQRTHGLKSQTQSGQAEAVNTTQLVNRGKEFMQVIYSIKNQE